MHRNSPRVIGVDFDNTIVCYDKVFEHVARERNLLPPNEQATKQKIRDVLRKLDREDEWTELQGYVYGARMNEAEPFPGVFDFFSACREAGIDVRIISHKTRTPYLGPKYDLHEAARKWIDQVGFYDDKRAGLRRDHVFFELTKEDKCKRIAAASCDCFVDDLPEFLTDPAFPEKIDRHLFDPAGAHAPDPRYTIAHNWRELRTRLCPGSASHG